MPSLWPHPVALACLAEYTAAMPPVHAVAEGFCPSEPHARVRARERIRRMPRQPLSEDEPLSEDGPHDAVEAPTARDVRIAEPPADGWIAPRAIAYTSPSSLPEPRYDLSDPDLPYWLAVSRVKGIGPARFKLLLDAFGTAEVAWDASPAEWQRAGVDARAAAAFEQQRRRIVPEAEIERLVKLRVGVVRVSDPQYPRLLREIPLPPPILYVRGTLTAEDDWAVAIVGTRRATTYGKRVTERLAGELARQRVTVVSGLARGIDTHAHTAALEAGGRTVAVLGCGPDLVYPPENAKLAARIVEQGAVVTEFAPSTQPDAGNFPARNRLISGLALGVLVTECPEDSGALITARFAGEHGRDVFAVPGNITSRSSAGANRLIRTAPSSCSTLTTC